MGMLGDKKNRGKHGRQECPYGCCRTIGKGSKFTRILRKREKRAWRKGQECS